MRIYRNLGKKKTEEDGYVLLSKAVVELAVEDYKLASMTEMPYSRRMAQQPLEHFFRSQWCYDLSGIQPGVWETFFSLYAKDCDSSDSAEIDQRVEIETESLSDYAAYLEDAMARHGITAARLAKETGLTSCAVSRYRRGIVTPKQKNRDILQRFFDAMDEQKQQNES